MSKLVKIFKFIFHLFLSPILNLIWLLSSLFPRNKNLWVFGSWFGKSFSDNSMYLFKFVNEQDNEIKSIWLTRDRKLTKAIEEIGYKACYAFGIKGIAYSLRAGCFVTSCGMKDINPYFIGGAKYYELWHGTPLKSIGYDNKNENDLFNSLLRRLLCYRRKKPDLLFASSEEVKIKLMSGFKVEEDNVVVTGYPRCDILFQNSLNNKNEDGNIDFIIGYFPTCRGRGFTNRSGIILRNILFKETEDLLDKINGKLLIVYHVYNYKKNIETKLNSKRIEIIERDLYFDPTIILRKIDVLITDYSSVFFDFLLLNRPIIFFPFDYEEFKEKIGFYYDYKELVPGPIASNWKEVLTYIKEFKENPDLYGEKRRKINNQFNNFQDNGSTLRVYKAIKNNLEV